MDITKFHDFNSLVMNLLPMPIRHWLVFFLATMSALSVQAQNSGWNVVAQVALEPESVTYPYNPDHDASGAVEAGDLIEFLIYFGNPLGFQVSAEDMATDGTDGTLDLSTVLTELASVLIAQQQEIQALETQLSQQQQVLALMAPLLSLTPVAERSSYVNDTWRLSGMNVQLDNGVGTTYGEANGLGNLILGYNEEEGGHRNAEGALMAGELRTGSHNLVLGAGHSYASNGGLLGGYNNSAFGQGASLLGGQASLASGAWSSVLGGLDNRAMGSNTCISGGHSNTASGDRASVSGGLLNISSGIATSILGGQYMQVSEQYETASGQYDIND